jgi:starch phosphorylase
MRESMARLAPRYSSNRVVREYTEQYYLPTASAFRDRCANKVEMGIAVVNWQHELEQKWPAVRFGDMNTETDGKLHRFDVQLYLNGLDPEAVRVELYANGDQATDPFIQHMKRTRKLIGAINGYAYSAQVPADRPTTDFTARLVPDHSDLSIPLEEAHILWQR